MHNVAWSLLLVMGCRSTKHLNSVSDDVTKVEKIITEDIITRSTEDNCNGNTNQDSKKTRQNKQGNSKVFMSRDLKEIGRNGSRSNGNNNKVQYSQSQLDFFEMLDKKIMEGKDYKDDTGHTENEDNDR